MHNLLHKIFRMVYPHKDPLAIKREYGLPENLNIIVRLADGWFTVTSPDLPGLVTQARDQRELIEMLNDAVLTYFDVPKKEADIVYDRVAVGNQVIEYRATLQTKNA